MVSSMMSSRFGEGFRRPSDREDIVYRDRGQLGLPRGIYYGVGRANSYSIEVNGGPLELPTLAVIVYVQVRSGGAFVRMERRVVDPLLAVIHSLRYTIQPEFHPSLRRIAVKVRPDYDVVPSPSNRGRA